MPSSPDRPGILITIDVEDHAAPGEHLRFSEALAPLLAIVRRKSLKATLFVVGSLASAWQAELSDLIAEGHEIGLHGYTHQHLAALGAAGLREELRLGLEAIANITGEPPVGFRAPYFSLTRSTPWAPDVLMEAGFTYSSSVLPAWNPQAGLPGAPRSAFKWPSGLVEFPVPVFGVGPIALPILAGPTFGSLRHPSSRFSPGAVGVAPGSGRTPTHTISTSRNPSYVAKVSRG